MEVIRDKRTDFFFLLLEAGKEECLTEMIRELF